MSLTLLRSRGSPSLNLKLDETRSRSSLIERRRSVHELDFHPAGDADSGPGAPLCELCQNFDIHSFTRGSTQTRGYLLRHVEAAAVGCEFCSLLFDSVKDIEKPTYFYKSLFGKSTYDLKPDLYMHMTLSENYSGSKKQSNWLPLGANRLSTEIGDRFSDVKSASKHELCLAADPSL